MQTGVSHGGDFGLLLERERELDILHQALDRLAQGAGSFLLIEGPAGIGKTTLLNEAAHRGQKRDLLVRLARGGELEQDIPFGLIRQLLEPVISRRAEGDRAKLLSGRAELALIALGGVPPGAPEEGNDPYAAIHGLYWLVTNLCESQPLLLGIDDAQWADGQTLRFVDYVSRRLEDLPAVFLITVRSGEPDPPPELEGLRSEATVLHPRSLTQSAVRRLIAADTKSEPSADFSEACINATGGNPFLVTEVLRALRADSLSPGTDAAQIVTRFRPENVARYALLRLGRFGPEAIELARAVAVLGGSPQLRHAAKLADLDEERARVLSDQLREAEILAPGLPLDFVHPLVRQAIYSDLPEGQRSAMHRRAAEVLAATGITAREIAPHLLMCAPNGDQWVVTQLRAAAAEARGEGAHDTARALLERLLQEPPQNDLEDRFWLGKALYSVDPARAPQFLEQVADEATDPELRATALSFAPVVHITLGNFEAAIRRCDDALDAVPEDDREMRLMLEAQTYCFSVAGRGWDAGRSDRIRSAAANLQGVTPAECVARQALGFDLFLTVSSVDEVVRASISFPPPGWAVRGTWSLTPLFAAKVLAWSGRFAQANEAMALFTEACHNSGRLHQASYGHGFLAEINRLAGRLSEAEAEAQTALEITSALGSFSPAVWQATVNLLATHVARGDLETAETLAEDIPMSLGPGDIPVTPWPIEIMGYLRLARGDLEGAVEDFLTLGEALENMALVNPAYPAWRQEVAPALAALGRTAEARDVIAVAEDRARSFGAAHVIGAVLRARGLLEPRRKQIETLRQSVSVLETEGPPHELARSLIEFGAAVRRDGQRSEAREPLRAALELAHRCGSGGLESRAREELHAAGARLRAVVRTGVGSLTASELRTARLAAQGLSNGVIAQRLFVTRRTVETHLTHVYEKLHIQGRADLKADLLEEGG